jgi:antitoxin component YwqK of YwqJK toxin-antitoxin module
VKDGEWIAYYPGGKMAAVISHYKNGELHGTMQQFSRRGKLLQEMDYKDGLKHGKFIMYDKKGKAIVEREYAYGMQVIKESTNTPGSFTPGR